MSWRTKLEAGRTRGRASDAVGRHQPVLQHLGRVAQGEKSAPVPPATGEVPEAYRWTSPPPPPPGPDAWRPALAGDGAGRRRAPGRGTTLGWLATLCAAATLALAVALVSSGGGSVRTSTSTLTAPSVTPPAAQAPATAPATAAPAPAPDTAPPPTALGTAPPATAPAPPPAGRGPVIASMSPASGPPGTAVTLTGQGLYSPSGSIVVLFGQVQAPVSCPTQQTCMATAPPQPAPPPGRGAAPGPPAVPVTMTTDSGRTAPVVFTYTG